MKKKILGLDLGITSVGFSVINYDDTNFEGEILEAGVRTFKACEVAKTKESLNKKRREARSVRRRLSRRSVRLRKIKHIFIKNGFIPEYRINNMFNEKTSKIDAWELRKKALNRKLDNEEFYRVIHQIAKRRGFKSTRKSEEKKSDGALLSNIEKNLGIFKESNYTTIGEMYYELFKGDKPKRNKRKEYTNSIPRELLQSEMEIIFEKQRNFGSEIAKKEIEEEIINIAFYQAPLKSMKDMVGNCIFEKNEKRAPKAAYSSEVFVAVQNLLNSKILLPSGETYFLAPEEINTLLEMAHNSSKVTYKQAKKVLPLDEYARFVGLNYTKKQIDKETKEEKIINPEEATFIELKKYYEYKKAIKDKLGEKYLKSVETNRKLFNDIAEVLTYEKSDDAIIKEMKAKRINEEIIEAVKDCSANKVMHLSITAMDKIIPYMLDGNKYHEACELAGYDFKAEVECKNLNYLPVLDEDQLTTNPVVNRTISQTRKVVNALIKKYNSFDKIIIETARDLGKSVEERNKIISGQKEFKEQKEKARKRCMEHKINPDSGNNLLRYRLWEEQGGKCIYSKKPIEIERLSEPNYTDIDHIIPYSRCYDDSLNNKVLCLADENRNKGNKIPFEYLGEKYDWYEYSEWIKGLNLKSAKTNRILRTSYQAEVGFTNRNLSDTRYITVFIKDYIKENLNFGKDFKVETRNGSLTAFLRHQWGLEKNREENDRHHALDAIVLACSTQGMVKYLSTISAQREDYDFIKNSKPKFKKPWENFVLDVEKAVSNIFVSRMLDAKIPGAMHEDTFRSPKYLNEGYTTKKTDLEEIKLANLENMHDKAHNMKLYNVIKERLEKFDNDPKKAFAEPIYMPLSEEKIKQGKTPHPIKSIKIKREGTSGIILPHGFANNDSMPRVDVFSKKNKKGQLEYFLVPIYVADFVKGILPNKAITRSESGWIEMTEEYEFCFSLFHDSLVLINMTDKKEDEFFGYFKGCDIDSARITLDSPDRNIKGKRLSPKSAKLFKKYQVDVLGNISEVKKEKRRTINFKNNKKKN